MSSHAGTDVAKAERIEKYKEERRRQLARLYGGSSGGTNEPTATAASAAEPATPTAPQFRTTRASRLRAAAVTAQTNAASTTTIEVSIRILQLYTFLVLKIT